MTRGLVALLALLALTLGGCKSRSAATGKGEQAAAEPTSDIGVPTRPVGCTIENVQRAVRPKRDAVTNCYRGALARGALARKPLARGKLAVEIHIDKAGTARFLGVQTDDFGDEAFTRCVFGVLKPLAYPLPDQEPCVVVYPFVFSAD